MPSTQEIQEISSLTLSSVTSVSVASSESRPWGSFTILEEGRGYKIKRIEVKSGPLQLYAFERPRFSSQPCFIAEVL